MRTGKTTFENNRRQYLFQGILKCSYCGCSLIQEIKQKKAKNGKVREYFYYHGSKGSPEWGRSCPQKQQLEDAVVLSLKQVYADDFIIDFLKKEMNQNFADQQKFIEDEKKRLNSEYKKNKTKMNHLYEDKMNNIIPQGFFKEKFQKLRERQEEVRQELMELDEDREESLSKGLETIELSQTLEREWFRLKNEGDIENMNNLLKMLYRTAKINEEIFEIEWNPGWKELVAL